MSKDASVNGSWTDRALMFTRTAVSRHDSDLERIALAVPSGGRKIQVRTRKTGNEPRDAPGTWKASDRGVLEAAVADREVTVSEPATAR